MSIQYVMPKASVGNSVPKMNRLTGRGGNPIAIVTDCDPAKPTAGIEPQHGRLADWTRVAKLPDLYSGSGQRKPFSISAETDGAPQSGLRFQIQHDLLRWIR